MPENLENQLDDVSPDLLTIEDEEGNTHEFEIIDQLDYENQSYVALIPAIDEDEEFDDEHGELIILKSEIVEEEEFLSAIEDEDEFNKIAAIFMERLSEEFQFDEE